MEKYSKNPKSPHHYRWRAHWGHTWEGGRKSMKMGDMSSKLSRTAGVEYRVSQKKLPSELLAFPLLTMAGLQKGSSEWALEQPTGSGSAKSSNSESNLFWVHPVLQIYWIFFVSIGNNFQIRPVSIITTFPEVLACCVSFWWYRNVHCSAAYRHWTFW